MSRRAVRRGVRGSTRRAVASVAIAVAAASIAACGVPTGSESFERIPDEELGRLAEPSTLPPTTTTMPPTTLPPPTSAPESTVAPTTTVSTVDEESVTIYFLIRGALIGFPQNVVAPTSEPIVRNVLEAGPPDDTTPRLTSEIDPGLIVGATENGGVMTVDLRGEIFDRIPSFREDVAIAQIVMTYTFNLRGVGQILFTIDGEPLPVRRGGSGILTRDPVSFDDYAELLADQPTPVVPDTTTTTSTEPTTTTTSTTVPPTTTTTTVAATTTTPG